MKDHEITVKEKRWKEMNDGEISLSPSGHYIWCLSKTHPNVTQIILRCLY